MNYALIENGIVTNIIWLYPANANDFPNAIPLNDIPAGIGDTYTNNTFYRDGEQLRPFLEERNIIIEELDLALIDATYESIMEGIER